MTVDSRDQVAAQEVAKAERDVRLDALVDVDERASQAERVVWEAWRQNEWVVEGLAWQVQRTGTVPHGILVTRRLTAPSGRPGTEWATNGFAVHEHVGGPAHILFEQGHYDLTRDEAFADFAARLKG